MKRTPRQRAASKAAFALAAQLSPEQRKYRAQPQRDRPREPVAPRVANSTPMNLRHHVTVALVGWYLMMPPGSVEIAKKAPLSKWEIFGSYDTSAACSADVTKLWLQAGGKFTAAQMANPKTQDELLGARYMAGACIATDDP